jgi:hypothetical protein
MALAPNTPPKKVDWEAAKVCLAELHRKAPAILQQAVLIGGIACWFYRTLLDRAADPIFPAPKFTSEEENFWLSKDIDFTNFFSEDARTLLRDYVVVDREGRQSLQVASIPIGFAQVGLTFDPHSAWEESWIGNSESDGIELQFRVLHPVSLFREKSALVQRRNTASDRSHASVLAEFLKMEICRRANELGDSRSLEQRTSAAKFLISVRDRAVEVCRDSRVSNNLRRIVQDSKSLPPLDRTLLNDLSDST